MKQFLCYLKTKSFLLVVLFMFEMIFAISFRLYRIPLAAVMYPSLLCLFFGVVFLAIQYYRAKNTYEKLMGFSKQSAETLSALPKPGTLHEAGYHAMIASLQQEVITDKASFEAKFSDMVDYYTVWAHQIKTPISSMKLTLQNEDTEISRRLQSDLFRTQQYVDMVLAFLRMGSSSGDYLFKKYDLDRIIRPSIKKFASEFISRRLSLSYEPIYKEFVTDEKWFAFMLEQLLSNALKYTKEGSIRIFMSGEDTLCIEDEGVGIAPEDLPRIFEKGYTGNNGRTDKTASGLGLYLCKRIADRLGIKLSVQSKLNQGTTLYLTFLSSRKQ